MNNVFVYCEIEGTQVQEVSQELLTKGRKLANQLGVDLNAIVAGTGIKGKVGDQILHTVSTSFSFSTLRACSHTYRLLTPTSLSTSSRRSSHR